MFCLWSKERKKVSFFSPIAIISTHCELRNMIVKGWRGGVGGGGVGSPEDDVVTELLRAGSSFFVIIEINSQYNCHFHFQLAPRLITRYCNLPPGAIF